MRKTSKLAIVTLLSVFALTGCNAAGPAPQRYGMVIGVKQEKLDYYRQLHANPWEGVLDQIDRSKLRNFSIWLVEMRPQEYYLFGYFEYTGDDFEADMQAMGEDDTTKRWWKETDPCQTPIPTARDGQRWVMMEEVFYHDKTRRGATLMPPPLKFEAGTTE
jgi:L-rhamnose mutarotase